MFGESVRDIVILIGLNIPICLVSWTRKNNIYEQRKYSEFLNYLYKFYLNFDHSFGLMNQDDYTTKSNNKCLKTDASTGNTRTPCSESLKL